MQCRNFIALSRSLVGHYKYDTLLKHVPMTGDTVTVQCVYSVRYHASTYMYVDLMLFYTSVCVYGIEMFRG